MSKFYKNIDWHFDPLINMDLNRFDKRINKIPHKDINLLFLEKLKEVGLKLIPAEPIAFYARPGLTGLTHVDGTLTYQWESRCKINWVNNNSTLTEWFDIEPRFRADPLSSTNAGMDYFSYDSKPKTLIESEHLNGWHLFEAGVPHRIVNHSTIQRWCLSFIVQPIEQVSGWATMDTIKEKLEI